VIKEITGYEYDEPEPEWSSYKEYLDSDVWRNIRCEALARDHGRCRDCGVEASEVHHIAYPEVLGREDLDDLVSLCHACHERRHAEHQAEAIAWHKYIDPDSPLGQILQSLWHD
jgi:5-methylcytosine-specific restriction endonuclease McrA